MKTKLLFSLICIFLFEHVRSQSDYCGTVADEKTLSELFNSFSQFNLNLNLIRDADLSNVRQVINLGGINNFSSNFDTESTVREVAINANIIRRTDGSGGVRIEEIENNITQLNSRYREMNISFYICDFNFINNNTHFNYSFDDSTHPDYITRSDLDDNNIENAINIYFVPNSPGTSWSSFPWSQREHIVMWNNHVTGEGSTNIGVLSHEIGHWFGLLHTHETARGRELVNQINCTTAGDGVCDTPADSRGSHDRESCTYNDDLRDANNDLYSPMVTNIMSYYFDCLNEFTNGQEQIVQSTLLADRRDVLNPPRNCSIVGERVEDYKWSEGWTSSEFYRVNNQTYLFLLKQKDLSGSKKNVHIHRMNNDGSVGSKVTDYKWSKGWTNTEFYTVNGQTYLFLLKQKGLSGSQKNVHIHKMNIDGTVGERVKDYKWSEGWTNTEFFTANNQTYLFLLKQYGLSGSDKNVHIHKMNNDGTIGKMVKDYKWSKGWTNTEFFTINNQTYLFLLKKKGLSESEKNVHIHKMNNDGTVGKRVKDYKWTEGWSNSEFFTLKNQNYLFLLKQEGESSYKKNLHIHEVNNNGTIGKRVALYKWTEGWTNTEFYLQNGNVFLFLLKQKGLSGSEKNVHIHSMRE